MGVLAYGGSANPHPLFVVWAGPVFGAMLPLVLALALRAARRRSLVAEIFSGFCLLANGTYVGVGSLGRIGDAGDMLKDGSPLWSLLAFGLVLAAAGLAQWHALGPGLGIRNVGKAQALWAAMLGALLLAGSAGWQAITT